MRQAAFEDRFETTITEPSNPNLLYTQQCDLALGLAFWGEIVGWWRCKHSRRHEGDFGNAKHRRFGPVRRHGVRLTRPTNSLSLQVIR
jgi:hypothetical protein